MALSPLEGDHFSLYNVYIFLFLDIIIYAVLVWYVENVFPGQYGLPRQWYFPIMPSYWLGHSENHESTTFCDIKLKQKSGFLFMEEELAELRCEPPLLTEPEPESLPVGVKIENLCKVYKQTKKLAVNHLCLNLYENQITAFLGINGYV